MWQRVQVFLCRDAEAVFALVAAGAVEILGLAPLEIVGTPVVTAKVLVDVALAGARIGVACGAAISLTATEVLTEDEKPNERAHWSTSHWAMPTSVLSRAR